MNCDDAFDALTDSAGHESPELTRHLSICPRCRDLQQVLEPAISLLRRAPAVEMPGAPPSNELEKDPSSTGRKKPFLTIEAIGVAEQAAAQLGKTRCAGRVRRFGRLFGAPGVNKAVRVATIVGLGGLAVLCIGLWDWRSDGQSLPAIAPPHSTPSGACTRNDYPLARKSDRDAARVVLTCVACHMNNRPATVLPVSTSLIWPLERFDRQSVRTCAEGLWNERPLRLQTSQRQRMSPNRDFFGAASEA
jgi:hypothetical protein